MVFGLAARRLKELRQSTKENETGLDTKHYTSCQPSSKNNETIRETFIETSAAETLRHQGKQTKYVCNLNELPEALSQLLACKQVIGIDIETYGLPAFAGDKQAGLEPRKSGIRLVQFYDGDNTVYICDILKLGGLRALGEEIWDKPMVAHNAMFELKHLLHKGANPKKLGCTLLCDRVINGNRADLREDLGLSRSAGLKDLSKEMLGLEVSKELQTSDWSIEILSQEQLEYAALDAIIVAKIFPMQWATLQKKGLVRAYQLLRDVQLPVARMELCGIQFNVTKHKQLIIQWHEESETLKNTILETLNREGLNLNSGKQLNEWLNEALKQEDLEAWTKTAGGKLSTSTPTFKVNEHMNVIFPKIVDYRHLAKRISSFGETLYKFIDIEDNRLYGSFSLGLTVTGRMSSRNPNMQNMPRTDFRDLFCVRPGYVLIGLDYSQQELRAAALITGDEELLRIYAEGGDVHINTAAAILKIPKEQVGKEQRQLAKAVIFGLLYGQGAKGLAIYAKRQYGVDMSENEAIQHRAGLFKTYKGLRQWQIRVGKIVEITGKIETPCGRIRDFKRERLGYRYTAALNLPIQGASAEIILHALKRLNPFLSEECRLVNVIHDEILLEVEEDKAEEYSLKAKEAMEAAFLDVFPNSKPYSKGLVEAKIGKNWAETK
jgi:DNA polymerase-1